VLDLLQKVTLAPVEVEPADVEAARRTGVSDEAIEDALYIAAYFNLVDRVADALGFHLPTPEEHAEYAPQFYEEGYGNEV
jgi:alkylhydroperoxidase family enzyme